MTAAPGPACQMMGSGGDGSSLALGLAGGRQYVDTTNPMELRKNIVRDQICSVSAVTYGWGGDGVPAGL